MVEVNSTERETVRWAFGDDERVTAFHSDVPNF